MEIIRKNITLFLLLIVTALLAVVPTVETRLQTGDLWRGVMPEYTNDTLYYLARMQDVGARGFFDSKSIHCRV